MLGIAVTNNGTLFGGRIDILNAAPELVFTTGASGQVGTLSLASTGVGAGTYTAITVNTKGQVTSAGNLTASGDATGTAVNGSIALTLATVATAGTYASVVINAKGLVTSGSATLAVANGGTGATTASGALTNLGAAPTASPVFTGTVSVSGGTIGVTGAAATNRIMGFQTAGSTRWVLITDPTAESGSNSGSNFGLYRYNDAGTFVDIPIAVSRATGVVTFSTTPSIPGYLSSASPVPVANGGTGASTAAGALSNLSAAPYGVVTVPITGGTVTLTSAQYLSSVLIFTGTLTSNANIVVPNTGNWTVINRTSGAFGVTIQTSGGVGIGCSQGYSLGLVADGSNVVISGTDAFSSGFLSTTAPTTLVDSTSGTASLIINGAGNSANGANIKLTGPGTNPSKFLRVSGGSFQLVNSAYTTGLLTIDDSGNGVFNGSVTSGSNTTRGYFIINGPASVARTYSAVTAGLNRWQWGASADTESGSSAGSNFQLYRYRRYGRVCGRATDGQSRHRHDHHLEPQRRWRNFSERGTDGHRLRAARQLQPGRHPHQRRLSGQRDLRVELDQLSG